MIGSPPPEQTPPDHPCPTHWVPAGTTGQRGREKRGREQFFWEVWGGGARGQFPPINFAPWAQNEVVVVIPGDFVHYLVGAHVTLSVHFTVQWVELQRFFRLLLLPANIHRACVNTTDFEEKQMWDVVVLLLIVTKMIDCYASLETWCRGLPKRDGRGREVPCSPRGGIRGSPRTRGSCLPARGTAGRRPGTPGAACEWWK